MDKPRPTPAAAAVPRRDRRWSDGAAATTGHELPWAADGSWSLLVAALAEQAVDSAHLLGRAVDHLVGAGRLCHAEARPLRESLDTLQAASRRAQQVMRLAGGRIRGTADRVALADVLQAVLEDRAAALAGAELAVSTEPAPVEVLLDPAAASALAGALVDWCLPRSGALALAILPPAGDGPARLLARSTPPMQRDPQPGRRLHDGLAWLLLRALATTHGVTLGHQVHGDAVEVTLGFPRVFRDAGGVASVDLLSPGAHPGQPGDQPPVLIVSGQGPLRERAGALLAHAGLTVSCAADLDAARDLLAGRAPGLLVVGPDLAGGVLHDAAQRYPVVEITTLPGLATSFAAHDRQPARVALEDLHRDLVPAVLFGLAHQA